MLFFINNCNTLLKSYIKLNTKLQKNILKRKGQDQYKIPAKPLRNSKFQEIT